MVTCTFISNNEIYRTDLDKEVEIAIESVLQEDTEVVFLVSGIGYFNRKCIASIRRLQQIYKHLDIRLILVLSCANGPLPKDISYYQNFYDEVVVLNESPDTTNECAIERSNRYMIDHSDKIIACVSSHLDMAQDLLQYAKKRGKRIINFPDIE